MRIQYSAVIMFMLRTIIYVFMFCETVLFHTRLIAQISTQMHHTSFRSLGYTPMLGDTLFLMVPDTFSLLSR
ncbi:hypothetical protein AHAS_Ahas01G0169800 [Arachis hypogaea]